jgi:hypothetical protein
MPRVIGNLVTIDNMIDTPMTAAGEASTRTA